MEYWLLEKPNLLLAVHLGHGLNIYLWLHSSVVRIYTTRDHSTPSNTPMPVTIFAV